MITALPGNQLEVLVDPLAKLLALPKDNPLSTDSIIVQHQGMERWLSMELASHPDRGICMNTRFPLPIGQFWKLIRSIIGNQVPEKSPFVREVMVWRIDEALANDRLQSDPAFAEPTRYWTEQGERLQATRRYQLSEEMADLFEQYMLYRPDWIVDWDNGGSDHWQAKLWRYLTQEHADEAMGNHPVKMASKAVDQMANPVSKLPDRLFMFGVNSLPPFWLEFLKALSDKAGVDIFIFYLNPSDEYWGDLVSERQIARKRAAWVESADDPETDLALVVGNPLLANLGHQGQAFVKLLNDCADQEIPVFGHPGEDTLLSKLQADLLAIRDGREAPVDIYDDSITISEAHSPLREVQALHDWLLHRFNEDPNLTPRDVLIMTPNVEDYAPFVEAVFARRFDVVSENHPPLPCTIADRSLVDADPTVAAFRDLLTLPDSRFQVTQVMAWLRVPAIAAQFELAEEDLDQLSHWLSRASVHWGMDQAHKQSLINAPSSSHYSWEQGLERLMLGFCWGDEEAVVGDRLLLPDVEGDQALQLGRVMGFLDRLRGLARDLVTPRTADAWQEFLKDRMRLALFSAEADYEQAHRDISSSIHSISEYCHRAGYAGEIPLEVVRHFLEKSFATPERTGRQFLAGQVTVCSMVPLRSIPFKVVAVLGLNDGEFPRYRPPMGFDLMGNESSRLGDRSTRGDDRYMFLESLMSARESVYLSYLGRDVQTNTQRMPSPVLGELLGYLEGSTSWSTDLIVHQTLLAHSPENYLGERPCFDDRFMRLAMPQPTRSAIQPLSDDERPDTITVEELVDFFDHPSRAFARQRLGLYLDNHHQTDLQDNEPFESNHLQRYDVQSQLVASMLGQTDVSPLSILERAELSGKLPDNPLVDCELDSWASQSESFSGHVANSGMTDLTQETVNIQVDGQTVVATLPRLPSGDLAFWRLADAKPKDHLRLWLNHLVGCTFGANRTTGLYRDRKSETAYRITLDPVEPAEAVALLNEWLTRWREARTLPMLWNAQIGIEMAKPRKRSAYNPGHFEQIWEGDRYRKALADDEYVRLFYPVKPEHDPMFDVLSGLYVPMFERLVTETAT